MKIIEIKNCSDAYQKTLDLCMNLRFKKRS